MIETCAICQQPILGFREFNLSHQGPVHAECNPVHPVGTQATPRCPQCLCHMTYAEPWYHCDNCNHNEPIS